MKALEEAEQREDDPKYIHQRNTLLYILKSETKYSNKQLALLCKDNSLELKEATISGILRKFGKNTQK